MSSVEYMNKLINGYTQKYPGVNNGVILKSIFKCLRDNFNTQISDWKYGMYLFIDNIELIGQLMIKSGGGEVIYYILTDVITPGVIKVSRYNHNISSPEHGSSHIYKKSHRNLYFHCHLNPQTNNYILYNPSIHLEYRPLRMITSFHS